MKKADINVGGVYVVGNKDLVNQGRAGREVIVLAIGKYTTVPAPCGVKVQPLESAASDRVVVAVRQKDQGWLQSSSMWDHETVKHSDDVWVVGITTYARIMMSADEYALKSEATREIRDMVNASSERLKKARESYMSARSELLKKLGLVEEGYRGWYHNDDVNVMVNYESFFELLQNGVPKGNKTLMGAVGKAHKNYLDAKAQHEHATTCATNASVKVDRYSSY